jgi:hypothetical protein
MAGFDLGQIKHLVDQIEQMAAGLEDFLCIVELVGV